MTLFFTADTHFGHNNIIKYCNRPFSSIEEMDEKIISNWNSRVKRDDVVFHLGDFCLGNNRDDFYKYFNRLNGKKILIAGNHDAIALKYKDAFDEYCLGYYDIKTSDNSIVLCHYAMRVWNKSHFGSWHLFGHNHGTLPDDPNSLSFDCGVDTNNFYPYSINEVREKMKKKLFVSTIKERD